MLSNSTKTSISFAFELGVLEKGIDKIPQIHLGVSASQMEQKGIKTSVIAKLYANKGAVKNQNKTVRDLKADNKVS